MLFRILKRDNNGVYVSIGIASGQSRKQAIEKLAGGVKPAFPQYPLPGYWVNSRGEVFTTQVEELTIKCQ